MEITPYSLNAFSRGGLYIPPVSRNERSGSSGQDMRHSEQHLQDNTQEDTSSTDNGAELLTFLSMMHPAYTLNITRLY